MLLVAIIFSSIALHCLYGAICTAGHKGVKHGEAMGDACSNASPVELASGR